MAKLFGKAKADFLARINRGRRKAGLAPVGSSRSSPGGSSSPAPSGGGSKKKRGGGGRRGGAMLGGLVQDGTQGLAILGGLIIARTLVNKVPAANTTLKQGLLTYGASKAVDLAAGAARKVLPLPRSVVDGIRLGLIVDGIARLTAPIRAKIPALSAAGTLASGRGRFAPGSSLSLDRAQRL